MRKAICIILIFITVLLFMNSGGVALATFEDIQGHWAEDAIIKWSGLGIINGYNSYFRPDDYVTRGEMAAIINRVMGHRVLAENSFRDLDDIWCQEPMLAAVAAGIFQGSGGYIRPQGNITREEAAAVFCRAFLVERSFGSESFDIIGASEWAIPELSVMYANGYIDDTFMGRGLKEKLTRAETVALLDAVIGNVLTSEYSGSISGNAFLAGNYLAGTTITGDLIIPVGVEGVIALYEVVVLGGIFNYSNAEILFNEGSHGEVFKVNVYGNMESPKTDAPEYLDYYGQKIPVQPGVPVFKQNYDNFSSDGGRIGYSSEDGNAALGIDVSAWQGKIDWAKVKADGVEFAMLRVGYRGYQGGSINIDSFFKQNAEAALANGIDIGVYFFSQAITPQEAVEEAQFVLNLIREYNIEYPVCFDWEMITEAAARTDGLPKETVTACAIAFCETISNAGYTPAVYIYTETAYFCYDLEGVCAYDLWFAKYAETPQFYYDFQMWQFTDSGSVDGISGKVDMNLSFKNYK